MEKYIVVHNMMDMLLKFKEGYELCTWTCNMTDPWRFKMRLLGERNGK